MPGLLRKTSDTVETDTPLLCAISDNLTRLPTAVKLAFIVKPTAHYIVKYSKSMPQFLGSVNTHFGLAAHFGLVLLADDIVCELACPSAP
jgi:hypothetical protein